MVKPTLRTKSIGTKVTDEEYRRLQALAGAQTLSEWARQVLLKQGDSHPGPTSTSDAVLLAELLGLRTILLNLFYALTRGDRITAQQMQEVIGRADAEKADRAAELLDAGRGKR